MIEHLISLLDWSAFLGLFIPALIGIAGSYGIYHIRQSNKRENLRRALRGEITAAGALHNQLGKGASAAISQGMMPTNVYRGSNYQMGLLSKKEIDWIVRYYSVLSGLERYVELFREYGDPDTAGMEVIDEKISTAVANKAMAVTAINSNLDELEDQFELADWMEPFYRTVLTTLLLDFESSATVSELDSELDISEKNIRDCLDNCTEKEILNTEESGDDMHYTTSLVGNIFLSGEIEFRDIAEIYQELSPESSEVHVSLTSGDEVDIDSISGITTEDEDLLLMALTEINREVTISKASEIIGVRESELEQGLQAMVAKGLIEREENRIRLTDLGAEYIKE